MTNLPEGNALPTRAQCRAKEADEYQCLGPYILTEDQRERGNRQLDAAIMAGDRPAIEALAAKLGPVVRRKKIVLHFDNEQLVKETLHRLGARVWCGKDLAPLIQALPFDGDHHTVACACGNTVLVLRPLAAEDAAAHAAALDEHLT